MNRIAFWIGLTILLIALVGCKPGAMSSSMTSSPIAQSSKIPTPKLTLTPVAKFTSTPIFTNYPTATRTSYVTLTSTPGADLSFLYLSQGSIHKFNLSNWEGGILSIQNNGEILRADLSQDQSWLAFQDIDGIKVLEKPFNRQPSIVPIVQGNPLLLGDHIRFLYSNDSELLAYSDGEGLKIFNLLEESHSLLFTHSLDQSDLLAYRFYSLTQWSPDDQWLWITVAGYEGLSRILVHIPTQTSHEYTACYSDIVWFVSGKALVATVNYSGYFACGNEGGIYIIELAKDNTIIEKRIYPEAFPAEPWERNYRYAALSPDGNTIGFVQYSFLDLESKSSLITIGIAGNDFKEIDSSQNDITAPIWSADGNKLHYTIQSDTGSQVISLNLDFGTKTELCSLPNEAIVISDLADSDWLIVGTQLESRVDWGSLYLVNFYDGAVVKLSELGYDIYIEPFLGLFPDD